MKHFGLEIPEGTNGVTNLTAPTGTSFPSLENAGELFFRTDSNKLYVHGTLIGGSPPQWIDLTATGGSTTLSGLSDVVLGSPISDNYVLTYDATSGTWGAQPPADGGTTVSDFYYIVTAATQSVFSGPDHNGDTLVYAPGSEVVFLDGVRLVGEGSPRDYTATNGTSIVLTTPATMDSHLQVLAFDVGDPASVRGEHFVYTATASQSNFSGVDDNGETLSYVNGQEMVFLNGVRLRRDGSPSDYDADDGVNINLNIGSAGVPSVSAGDTIQVFVYNLADASTGTLGGLLDVTLGSPLSDGQVLTYDSATQLWGAEDVAATLGQLTDVTFGSPISDGHVLTYDSSSGLWGAEAAAGGSLVSGEHFIYEASGAQTVFTGADHNGNVLSYVPGQEMVFLNGVRLRRDGSPNDYTASNGTSIILNVATAANDHVQIFAYGVSAAEQLFQQSQDRQSYIAHGGSPGQTVFAANYTVGFVDVFLNGARLSDAGSPPDFIATDGNTIVLTTPAAAGALVEIIGYTTADVSSIATRKNAIINGDMRISQRGTSFPALGSTFYGIDRWSVRKTGVVVWTMSQESSGGPNDNFPYWMKMLVTTPDSSIIASDRGYLYTIIEGYDYAALRGKECTISFWVRDAVTGTHCVALASGSDDSSYIMEYTIGSADTWEYKTLTLTLAETFGTWAVDNTAGIRVQFAMLAGTDWHGSANTWLNTSNDYATSNIVNSAATTSNVFGLTGVQLEIGSSATTFDHRPFEQEYELCRRYYHKSFALETAPADGASEYGNAVNDQTHSTGTVFLFYKHITPMRTIPSLTLYNPRVGGTAGRMTNSAADDSGVTATTNNAQKGFMVQSGAAQGANNWYVHFTADAEL